MDINTNMIKSKNRNMMYLIGVLYSQNSVSFHGTLVIVISFVPVRKLLPSLSRFSRNSQVLNSIIGRPRIAAKSDNTCGRYG
jgi:hypothetical protein